MNLRSGGPSGSGDSGLVFEKFIDSAAGGLLMRRLRPVCDPQLLGELAPFYQIWRAKLRGDELPRWQDFSFGDFTGWHRNVALSDISSASADPRFRIFGSGAVELLGEDLTGKQLTESVPAAEVDGVIAHFAQIRDHKLIGLLSGKLGKENREFIQFMVIELPLVNDAGEVSQILHAFYRLP